MPTKAGLHVVSGSRNGYGQVIGMACVTAVNEGGALWEAKSNYENTVTIFRLTEPSPFYLEAPQGFDQWNTEDAIAHANWIYPQFRDKWRANKADYYIVLNEPFNEQPNIPVYLAYERQLIDLAFHDGYKICMLNLAGGSPSMGTWESYVVPHLAYGFSKGAIYGRHAYGGELYPLDGNTSRPMLEADYLQAKGISGGIAITELGYHGGYEYDHDLIVSQYPLYDAEMRKHPNIIGSCLWTLGNSFESAPKANCERSMSWFSEYVGNDKAEKWTPQDMECELLEPSKENIIKAQNCIIRLSNNPTITKLAESTIHMIEQLDCEETPPTNEEFYIIDISHHNNISDSQWDDFVNNKKVKAVIIRLMFGINKDEMFQTHYENAISRGLDVLVYGFPLETIDPIKQADAFVEELSKWTVSPIIINDVEPYKDILISIGNYKAYVNRIKTIRKNQLTYSSKNFYDTVSKSDNANTDLHVADWIYQNRPISYPPNRQPILPSAFNDWKLWQVCSTGFDGNSRLDVNIFNGTHEEFKEWVKTTDDKPTSPPESDLIDVWSYMMPKDNNVTYEVKHKGGGQERIQNQHGNFTMLQDKLYIVKGENQGYYEKWTADEGDSKDNAYIYLTLDTSPSNDSNNTPRYYEVDAGRWCKRYMRIGETFNDGGHHVQFYAKSDCRPLDENSGYAENNTTLIAHYPTVVKNGIVLNDCIEIGNPNGERHIFCKGIGRVAWYSAWGSSEISELHKAGDRPVIQREVIGCM